MPETIPVLYHGTTPEAADVLLQRGWHPRSGTRGANQGQPRFLYLTTIFEDALWFAEQKGSETVIEVVDVPTAKLMVDPEDGTSDSLETELALPFGLPGKLVLTGPLSASHFRLSLGPAPAP